MKYSGFKQQVIKSGIPLEKTVSEYLLSHGIVDFGEYAYERDNTLFSIDIIGMSEAKFSLKRRDNLIYLQFLVECKHKEPNHVWVFASYCKSKKAFSFRLMSNLVYVNFPFERRLKKYGYRLQKKKKGFEEIYNKPYDEFYFPRRCPLVNACTEIINDKTFNPKAISEAIHQVVFGVGSAIVDSSLELLEEEVSDIIDGKRMYGLGYLGRIIFPMVVTTADLLLIKAKQTIDDIRRSKHLEEAFEKVDAVLLCPAPNHELTEFTRKKFEKYKDDLMDSTYFTKKTIEQYIQDLSNFNTPILIVTFTALRETLLKILSEINRYFGKLSGYSKKVR